MGMKKQSSLKTAFWHFLFKLFGGLLGTVAVPFLLMNISTALGVTTYGDYSEIRSNELASVLAATPDLSEVEIPMGIEYVLLDKSYQIIETMWNSCGGRSMPCARRKKSDCRWN